MARPLLLLVLVLVACADDRRPATDPAPATTEADPPTPFDSAEVDLDTLEEPPGQTVQIPPRPAPAPPALPSAPPVLPQPPQPPITRGPAGSCDVRGPEGYCLTFTGEGWTPESARSRCEEAPDAAFSPGTCPVARRTATCTYTPSSTPGRETVYTYYAPYDVALAELACPGDFERFD